MNIQMFVTHAVSEGRGMMVFVCVPLCERLWD